MEPLCLATDAPRETTGTASTRRDRNVAFFNDGKLASLISIRLG
jgi:hypothetical protein